MERSKTRQVNNFVDTVSASELDVTGRSGALSACYDDACGLAEAAAPRKVQATALGWL